MAKKLVTLDGAGPLVVADAATKFLDDKETRDDIREGVKTVATTAFSFWKYAGYTVLGVVGVSLLVWGGKKLIGVLSETADAIKDKKRQSDNMSDAQSKTTKEKLWFTNAVADLKTAMGGCKEGFNHWVTSYNSDKISAILRALGNQYDWQYLCGMFGTIDGHGLADWLGCDGWSDRSTYNDILKSKGVEEQYLVTNPGLFAGNALIK